MSYNSDKNFKESSIETDIFFSCILQNSDILNGETTTQALVKNMDQTLSFQPTSPYFQKDFLSSVSKLHSILTQMCGENWSDIDMKAMQYCIYQ